jgi:hypothetical protein
LIDKLINLQMTETQGLNDVNEELERYRNALVKMEA